MKARWKWAAGALVLLLAAGYGGYRWLLSSDWLLGKIRERVLTEATNATGGEARLDAVRFDPDNFTVDIEGLTILGTDGEPFAEVPLLRLGVGIESLLSRRIYVSSMSFEQPRARIHINPDGTSNIPTPPQRLEGEMLSLTTRLFEVRGGVVEYQGEPYQIEVRAEGLDLDAERDIDCTSADLLAERIEWRWRDFSSPGGAAEATVSLCGQTLDVERAVWREGGVEATLAGTVDGFPDAPVAELAIDAEGELQEWLRRTDINGGGRFALNGELRWADGVADYSGDARIDSGRWAHEETRLEDVGLTTRFAGDGDRVRLEPLEASALGGRFAGFVEIADPFASRRGIVEGEIKGFRLRQAFRAAGVTGAPWTAALDAWVHAEGTSLEDLSAQSTLQLLPLNEGRPVSGVATLAYSGEAGVVEIPELDVTTGASRLTASGVVRPDGRSSLRLDIEAEEPDDLFALLRMNDVEPDELPATLLGDVEAHGKLEGRLYPFQTDSLYFEGSLRTGPVEAYGYRWDSVATDISADPQHVSLTAGRLADGQGAVDFHLDVDLSEDAVQLGFPLAGEAVVNGLRVEKALEVAGLPPIATGAVQAEARIAGTTNTPDVTADVAVTEGILWKEPFDRLSLHATTAGRRVRVDSLALQSSDQVITGSGSYDYESRELTADLEGSNWSIGDAQLFSEWAQAPAGRVEFGVMASGVISEVDGELFRSLDTEGQWTIDDLRWGEESLGPWSGSLEDEGDAVHFVWSGNPLGGAATGEASVRFVDATIDGGASFEGIDPGAALRLLGMPLTDVEGESRGSVELRGSLLHPETLEAEGSFENLELRVAEIPGSRVGYELYNPFPMRWAYRDGALELEHMRLAGEGTNIEVDGDIPLAQGGAEMALTAEGDFNLTALNSIFPDIEADGLSVLDIRVSGGLEQPQVNGAISIRNASVRSVDFPNGLTGLEGELTFEGRELRIEELTASSGGGRLSFSGSGRFGDEYDFRFVADAERVRVRYPENLSSLVNGRLTLAGDRNQSLLAGEILVTRVATNAEVSLGDLLAALREPQRTPPKSSMLENLQFNVHVTSGADLDIETALIRDMEASVDLRLVGSWVSPSLLGRIDISSGQMNFHGSRYTLNRGEIAFVNPFRVEPVLDFELETRIRNIDIALILAGPARRLNLAYRSDPPLPFADLVNLVALGRTPTFDPVLSSQQRIQQQSLFQTGANNVFSQAVERPVSPGLQRFFGVSRLKVDPQVGGAEANPTARISTEQQITNEVTLIYTYDVSSSNQQTVRLEYAPDRTWTFVLTRDENGLVGGDVLYKTRLK